MTSTVPPALRATRRWFDESACSIDDFIASVAVPTDRSAYPHADRIERGVVIYDSQSLLASTDSAEARRAVQAELIHALEEGPGIVVFAGAFDDRSVVDRATQAFQSLIDEQRADGLVSGDHFAKAGANDRVWNALEKLAVSAPDTFAEYYANDILALVSVAWLGPGYQVTSQINVVNPGGEAQSAHRDYHLGFMDEAQAAAFPAHTHRLSPTLTLQGAVAHTDMPPESGPTLYLPHSQKYDAGYLAFHRPEFRAYFAKHHVQLPLSKGDTVFFNPALFHGAGHNHSADIRRMANLLQISSAFGRAMETVDRARVTEAIFPALIAMGGSGASERAVDNAIAASAEGYAFPSNLDRDQPVGGIAPETQADLVRRAVREGWRPARLAEELSAHGRRRLT